MPEFHASTVRLEALQHLVVASARGCWRPHPCWFRSWLNTLGYGYAGRLEDPAEDVFVSRVSGPDADCLIFQGTYEGSAFHLQSFLRILSEMPDERTIRWDAASHLCAVDDCERGRCLWPMVAPPRA